MLGIFYFYFLFFSEKNTVCRDRTHVPTCQKVTRLPLSYRGDRQKKHVLTFFDGRYGPHKKRGLQSFLSLLRDLPCPIDSSISFFELKLMSVWSPCIFPSFWADLTANCFSIYQYRRGVSLMISLQPAHKRNAYGNSYLATMLHTPRVYFCSSNPNELRREGGMKNTIPAQPYGQSRRVLTHLRTIWPGGRQYEGDTARQLPCITAVCTYQY